MDNNSFTNFASGERSSDQDIQSGYNLLSEERSLLDILGAISGITAIIDQNRQIIYANNEFINLIGMTSLEELLGKRPGEAIGCIHSDENSAGCGTTSACSVCGAVRAIIESQKSNTKTEKETRITSGKNENLVYWDLRVSSSPVVIRNRTFYVFTVRDISKEKRLQTLERTFFHDILNSAGNLNGILNILKEGTDPVESKELINLSEEVSREIIDEIVLQRQLRSAENGDLVVKIEKLNASDLLKSAVSRISGNAVAKGKTILIVDHSGGSEIYSDRLLLQRILINMLKNAVEATMENGTVFAEAEEHDTFLRYSVKNDQVIPYDVQMQIFQRSFSTKGKGRGTGTYSIRLLAEKYLGGKVGFTSSDLNGTTFFIELPIS
jgi:signal transduction histidine kinase